jgi:uncharacterized protein YecT (DUF1311 family)
MRRTKLPLIVCPLIFFPLTADADQACKNDPAKSATNECAVAQFAEADGELNRIWPEIVAAAKHKDRLLKSAPDAYPLFEDTIVHAQRGWLQYRDHQCQFEGFDVRGGSMQPMVINLCRTQMTLDRIKQLQEPNQVSGEPRN